MRRSLSTSNLQILLTTISRFIANMSKEVQKTVIPSRVVVKRAIEIAQSHIPNAGRGLFGKENIKDGQLIFTIPRPHIIIVSPALFIRGYWEVGRIILRISHTFHCLNDKEDGRSAKVFQYFQPLNPLNDLKIRMINSIFYALSIFEQSLIYGEAQSQAQVRNM